MKPIIGLENEKISAAKSMGSKMTKVLEKNKDPSIKTGLDAFL